MTPKRIQWLCAVLSIVGASVYLYAQNPVSISQVGTTGVTTSLPVQGIVGGYPVAVTAAQSGAWTVGQSGSPWGVLGTLSNNNASPGANQLDVMPCVVGASAPSYTDGRSAKPRCGTGGQAYVEVTNGSATATIGGTASVAYTSSVAADPCQSNAKSYEAINGTAGATIVTGTSAKKIYLCSLNILSATAQNLNFVSGTGTVCATGITAIKGLAGGTTAGTGYNFAANGGIALGNGGAAIAQVQNNADNFCLLTSSSGQYSGGITYVVQ